MKYLKEYKEIPSDSFGIDWKENWEEEENSIFKDIPIDKPREFYRQFIGREVMIKPSSEYYGDDPNNNPKDKTGTIIKTSHYTNIGVSGKVLFIDVE